MKTETPLVSVIIPTYNRSHYFQIALKSVLMQSYRNIEIVVVDDSTNEETYHCIQMYLQAYPHIKYYRNRKNLGGAVNFIQGYKYCTGEYVNFLMDDDVFHPNKIEIMLDYFLKDTNQEITLVTSYRSFINEQGYPIPDSIYNKRRYETVTVIEGLEAGSSIVSEFNWIGEPTTPLFRKKDLIKPFGVFSDRLYRSGVDIAAWLNLLAKGKLVFIPEPLSQLRLHTNNISKDHSMKLNGIQDLVHLLFHCRKHNFLLDKKLYKQALYTIYEHFIILCQQLPLTEKQQQECKYYGALFEKLCENQKKEEALYKLV
ncbi:glycosyltransferase family 2 protein [Bacillus wiedmannii]|uniref:glycosyltransferase family 2 protein n=1 Tax=Bacillus wiedmannii TaxID=1890302 RepID=UPI0027304D79|nr:glycosyltransferase family 2 protein [Bacillus wiedmannii]MDP1459803.1 glycosyltransferase family 2 protein [Bacillus wiedmannii]